MVMLCDMFFFYTDEDNHTTLRLGYVNHTHDDYLEYKLNHSDAVYAFKLLCGYSNIYEQLTYLSDSYKIIFGQQCKKYIETLLKDTLSVCRPLPELDTIDQQFLSFYEKYNKQKK